MLHGPRPGATAVQTTAKLAPCRLRCLRARALPSARHVGLPVVQKAVVTFAGRSCAGHVPPSYADRHSAVSRRPVHKRRQRISVQCLQQQQREETATVDDTQVMHCVET